MLELEKSGRERMHIKRRFWTDLAATTLILGLAVLICFVFQSCFGASEQITNVFIFAVFLVSLWTDGYFFGIASAFLCMLTFNYAFTMPYYYLNFSVEENIVSALVMLIIAASTSALTSKLKIQDAVKAESEKERMRANLLRAVSHDLRTPLTSIYGSASMMLENREQMNIQQRDRMLLGIREDAQWLIRMVENLLSITRIDNGKVKLLKTSTVLDELIDAVAVKFRKRYPDQELHIDIPDDIVMIPMDAILIEQVIINILENAVQHAKGMKHLSLQVYVLGKRAIFEVRDDGCGIREDRLHKLFTGICPPEEHAADSCKRNAGIGLSVCATIIKAHGGDISAENSKNGGAVFRFTLDTEEAENHDEQ